MVSTLPLSDALARGESFDPGEPSIMQYSPAVAADSSCVTANQIADLLAVVMWADILLIDEVEAIGTPTGLAW